MPAVSEDTTLPTLKRLSRELVQHDRGRVLVLSFHGASLQPGNTPLVRTALERDQMLDRIDGFLAFFFRELNGFATTPAGLLALASATSGPDRPKGAVGAGLDAKTHAVRQAVPLSDRSLPPQQVKPVAHSEVDLT